jgi:hypothetical protein
MRFVLVVSENRHGSVDSKRPELDEREDRLQPRELVGVLERRKASREIDAEESEDRDSGHACPALEGKA